MTDNTPQVDPGCGADSRRVAATPETLDALDKRKTPYKRFQAIACAIASDLGGAHELSEARKQLVDRSAFLGMQLERMEAAALAGHTVDLDMFGRLADRQRRLLETIGIERRAKNVTSLNEYLSTRAREAAGEIIIDVKPTDSPDITTPIDVYLVPRAAKAVAE